MSQPDTNLAKQRRRHAGPLIGITLVLIFAGVLFVAWFGYEAVNGTAPAGAEATIDGRTGEREEVAPNVLPQD